MQSGERLKLISDSLPILAEISNLKENNKITPEEEALLRRATIKGATKFCESGIIIPELYEHSTSDPRQLMAPELKLLMAPKPQKKATKLKKARRSKQKKKHKDPDIVIENEPDIVIEDVDIDKAYQELQSLEPEQREALLKLFKEE